MKTIITVLGLLLLVSACSTKQKINFIKYKKMEIPQLSNTFLKGPAFKELSVKVDSFQSKTKRSIAVNPITLQESYNAIHPEKKSHIFGEKVSDNEFVNYSYSDSVLVNITINSSYPQSFKVKDKEYAFQFSTGLDYYPDGSLKTKTISVDDYYSSFNIGKWERYDEQGNLVETIDHEQHFHLNYFDVLKITEDYFEIDSRLAKPRVSRAFNDKEAYWILELNNYEGASKPIRYVIIDDKTSRVVYDNKELEFDPTEIERYYFRDYKKKLYQSFFNR